MKKLKYVIKAAKARKKIKLKIDKICLGICRTIPQPFIVDVGAWRGRFLEMIHNGNGNTRSLAIEPLPGNVEILRGLDIKNMEIFNGCIADKDGMVELFVSGRKDERRNKAMMDCSIYRDSVSKFGTAISASIQCSARTLNSLFLERNINHVDIVLMNCEGAEYDIMLSDTNWLSVVDRLYLHLHTKSDLFMSKEYYDKRVAIVERLKQRGFAMEYGMDNLNAKAHILQLWKKT